MPIDDHQFMHSIAGSAHPDLVHQARESVVRDAQSPWEVVMMVGYPEGQQGQNERLGVPAAQSHLFSQMLRVESIGIQREMWTVLFYGAYRKKHDIHLFKTSGSFRPSQLTQSVAISLHTI